jgi:hypothetical protein
VWLLASLIFHRPPLSLSLWEVWFSLHSTVQAAHASQVDTVVPVKINASVQKLFQYSCIYVQIKKKKGVQEPYNKIAQNEVHYIGGCLYL